MVKKLFLILLIILPVQIFSQEISFKAEKDQKEYKVGDIVKLSFTVKYNSNCRILKPAIKDSLYEFEVLNEKPPVTKVINNQYEVTYAFDVTRYDSSLIIVPSIPVYYAKDKDTLAFNNPAFDLNNLLQNSIAKVVYSNTLEIPINYVSVKIDEDIKDIKEPMDYPPNYLLIAIYILGGIIVIVLIYYFGKKYLENKKAAKLKNIPPPVIPPHVLALQRIEELEKENLLEQNKEKEYYSGYSLIIKEYYKAIYYFDAPEMTTSEILRIMRQMNLDGILSNTRILLELSDRVKFAKYKPVSEDHKQIRETALKIIETTKPLEEEVKVDNPE